MKANKLTPDKNVFWESSRIILPEHREAIQKHRLELNKKGRPILDEQKWEELERIIQESLQYQFEIEVELYGKYNHEFVQGVITKIDQQLQRLKINDGWISLKEIIDARPL